MFIAAVRSLAVEELADQIFKYHSRLGCGDDITRDEIGGICTGLYANVLLAEQVRWSDILSELSLGNTKRLSMEICTKAR